MTDKKTHGGSRKGAGRKKIDDNLRKVPFNTRLPYWLVLWLRDHELTASELIETALVEKYNAK